MAKPSLVQPLSHTDACQARVAAPSIRFCVLVQLQIAVFDPAFFSHIVLHFTLYFCEYVQNRAYYA